MNLVALLAERATESPDRPALIDHHHGADRVLTFRDLLIQVEQGAGRLQALGLTRGHTILVFQPVSIELYLILLSAFHAGMRVMLADPSAGREFLSHCCQRLAPDAFFGPWKAHLLRQVVSGLRRIPRAIRSSGWFPGASPWDSPAAPSALLDVPDDEPALVTFTSGSTGLPKAAVRTHGFLLAQHRTLAHALDFAAAEVDLVTLPVFVLANLASGLTSVLADTDLRRPGQADAAAIRAQCQRHQATRCAASPAFFEALLRSPDSFPPLRKVFTGGAPVFPDLLARLTAALPAAEVVAVFGSTEAEPMTHLAASDYTPDRLAATRSGAGLCAGTPVPEIELRILRNHWGQTLTSLAPDAFEALLLPPGEPGEVVVSGDHVLSGYLGGIGDEETKIRVGGRIWHRTGDAGWLDPAGLLWLLGRCSAKLPAAEIQRPDLPAGALDYPFAIESALRVDHPAWRTAAIGWQDQRTLVIGGQPPAATLQEMDHAARQLGIVQILLLDELPLDRRHHAKIDYPALFKKLESLGTPERRI